MTANYYTGLDDIGKIGPKVVEDIFIQYLQTTPKYKNALSELFEQLLMFDKIALKVEGDNFSLAVLVNELGLDVVQECIEEGIIEFVLRTPMILTEQGEGQREKGFVDKDAPPIMNGWLSDPKHIDPYESIRHSFSWIRESYDSRRIRRFAKDSANYFRIIEAGEGQKAIDLTLASYLSNKLVPFGVPNNIAPNELGYKERVLLQNMASKVLNTTILINNDYSSFDDQTSLILAAQAAHTLKKNLKIQQSVNKILTLEKMPDFKTIFLEYKFNLKIAIELRHSRNAEYFRKWVDDPGNYEDAEYVTKNYVDSIAGATGILDTNFGKTAKMISLWAIGLGIGNFAGGIPGSFMGIGLSAIFQNAFDYGLDLMDTYILGNILRGKHPKLFISEVEDKVKFKQFYE